MNRIYNGLCSTLILLGILMLLGSVESPYLSTEEIVLCSVAGIIAVVVGWALMDERAFK